MYGIWHTSDLTALTSADLLHIVGPGPASLGADSVQGFRAGTTRILVGGFMDDGSGRFNILLDSSTSFYYFWVFDPASDDWAGLFWVVPKAGSLTGSGAPTFGSHLFGKNASLQAISASSAVTSRDETDAAIYAKQIETGGSGKTNPDVARAFVNLARALESAN